MPNITNAGSMWDQSMRLYPYAQGTPNKANYHWEFPSKARVEFASLQYEDSVLEWKSSEIALIGFDQVEEFTESQFWYMVSRNRSTCGIRPYIRCTINPVPEDDKIGGWAHKLISWWLNEETGLARPERDGVIRWFIRIQDSLHWYDTKEQAIEAARAAGFQHPEVIPKSFCFIASKLEHNQKLMTIDPQYYANLMALPMVERERLLGGNWKIRPSAGNVFNRAWFSLIDAAPIDTLWVRYWDKAGTAALENPKAAYTAGVKMGYSPTTGGYYVGHVARGQYGEFERERLIQQCAQLDTSNVTIYVEQEPGSGGKESARHTIIHTLPGFACYADKVRGDKYFRARPFAAMVQALNVSIVKGDWNEAYLSELHNYDPTADGWKDQVDASSGAFNKLTAGRPLEDVTPQSRTAEEEQVVRDEQAEQFRQQVAQQGCYFPGD